MNGIRMTFRLLSITGRCLCFLFFERKCNVMENVCVDLRQVEISLLDREVLNIDRLAIHEFDCIGIVGSDGVGMSKLLKWTAGCMKPDKGIVKKLIDFSYFEHL